MKTIPQTLELAVQHHRAGRLAEAEALYRQILAVQPNHFDALHLLGVVAHQSGRHDRAAEWICQAITLEPTNAAAHFNLGEVYRTLNRSEEAMGEYHRALELNPNFAEAHNNMGNMLMNRDRHAEAIAAFHQAIQLQPRYVTAHFNLGNTLREQGRLEEALLAYRRTLELEPNYLKAELNVGSVLRSQGHLNEAAVAYRRAIELQPDCVDAYNNLGITQTGQGQLDEAIAVFRRGLQLEPEHAVLHLNLGIALTEKGRLDEAVAAIRRALRVQPDFPETFSNLATALCKQGLLDGAVTAYRRGLELKPEDAAAHSSLIFTLHLHPGYGQRGIEEEQRRWERQFGEPARCFARPHRNDRNPERRLRIGYLSADFRAHVTGFNVLPLLKGHDPGNFEVLCYSAVLRPDALTQEFRRQAEHWRNIVGMTDEALAEMIRHDGVDILVDLMQHTAGNRLPVFARRPAPVQVSFAAYPGSTGLEAIAYRISDRYLEAEIGEGRCEIGWKHESDVRSPISNLPTEKLYFIDSFWCYRECAVYVKVSELPAKKCGRVTFGSLGNFAKTNEPVLKLWTRVLKEVTGSRLIFLSGVGSHRQRTLEILKREGIEVDRVELIEPRPHGEYLDLYHRLDIVLDTFPYNGHTTNLDALWMGVPVVSLTGDTQVSRGGLSILTTLDLPEFVAHSEDDYVRIATRLAGDLSRLEELRETLRAKLEASVFMNAPRFVGNIETAYRQMWRRWCAEETEV